MDFSRPIVSFLATSFTLLSFAAQAETLEEYVQTCKSELQIKTIPEFSCFDGKHVPAVDPNAYLGKLDVGNSDVDAVYLCRGTHSPTRANLVGLIIHNNVNQKTCFFDAHRGGSSELVSLEAANATNYWKSPAAIDADNINGNCHRCHENDAILATNAIVEGLASLDMMNNGRKLNSGLYDIVGEDFNHWNNEMVLTQPDDATCNVCHQWADNGQLSEFALNMPPANDSPYLQNPLPLFEPIENSTITWTNGGSHPWIVHSGSTPSSNTGPSAAPLDSNQYIYIETSAGGGANSAGNNAILESPYFNAENASLLFDYHMYGDQLGTLYVDVLVNGTWLDGVWSKDGSESNASSEYWQGTKIDLSGFGGSDQSIKVRFRAVAAGGWRGDIALDNITVERKHFVKLKNRESGLCLEITGQTGPTSVGLSKLSACDDNNVDQNLFLFQSQENKFRIGGVFDQFGTDYCLIVYYGSGISPYACSSNTFSIDLEVWASTMNQDGYRQFSSLYYYNTDKCLSWEVGNQGEHYPEWEDCSSTSEKQQWKVLNLFNQ